MKNKNKTEWYMLTSLMAGNNNVEQNKDIIYWKIGIGSTFYLALPSTFKKITRIYH